MWGHDLTRWFVPILAIGIQLICVLKVYLVQMGIRRPIYVKVALTADKTTAAPNAPYLTPSGTPNGLETECSKPLVRRCKLRGQLDSFSAVRFATRQTASGTMGAEVCTPEPTG